MRGAAGSRVRTSTSSTTLHVALHIQSVVSSVIRALRSLLLPWTIMPLVAIMMLTVTFGRHLGIVLVAVVAVVLASAVLAAVHHSDLKQADRLERPDRGLVTVWENA